jgi:hypothetical protein
MVNEKLETKDDVIICRDVHKWWRDIVPEE